MPTAIYCGQYTDWHSTTTPLQKNRTIPSKRGLVCKHTFGPLNPGFPSTPPCICPCLPHFPLVPTPCLAAWLDGGSHTLPAWQVVSAVPTHCMPVSASSKKKKKLLCGNCAKTNRWMWQDRPVLLLDLLLVVFWGCLLQRFGLVMLSVCSAVCIKKWVHMLCHITQVTGGGLPK